MGHSTFMIENLERGSKFCINKHLQDSQLPILDCRNPDSNSLCGFTEKKYALTSITFFTNFHALSNLGSWGAVSGLSGVELRRFLEVAHSYWLKAY